MNINMDQVKGLLDNTTAQMVGSFLYLLKKDDLISDKIPVLGIADDLAVLGLALKLSENELQAFSEWRRNRTA